MFDSFMNTVHDTTATALRMQFEMFRPWFQVPLPMPAPLTRVVPVTSPVPVASAPAVVVDQFQGYQKDLAGFVTTAVEKQRAIVDAQYAYMLKVLKGACELMQSKDIDQFQKSYQSLLSEGMEGAIELAEGQVRETQEVVAKLIDVLGEGGRVMPAVVEELVPQVLPVPAPAAKPKKKK